MGKRGPRPKPTNLRVLHGDRPDLINHDEPTPADGLPECPEDASDEVREVWNYTLDQLIVMGTATPADRDALRAYCEAVVTHRKACDVLARSPVLIRGQRGNPGTGDRTVRNPALQVQRDSAAQLRAFAQEFGFTPAARSEIHASASRREAGDPQRLLS